MIDKKNIKSYKVYEISVDETEKLADYWVSLNSQEAFRIGVDTDEIPNKSTIIEMLKQQIALSKADKNTFILIWELNGVPVGHSNITPIEVGNSANVHFHIWESTIRNSGLGEKFMLLSIPIFVQEYRLDKLYGVFHKHNLAAEKLFQKLGFTQEDEYESRTGDWSFYQTVKKYVLNKEEFESLI